MPEFQVDEILPVKAISDTERRQRAWILRKKLKKKKMEKLKEKQEKKTTERLGINIYV